MKFLYIITVGCFVIFSDPSIVYCQVKIKSDINIKIRLTKSNPVSITTHSDQLSRDNYVSNEGRDILVEYMNPQKSNVVNKYPLQNKEEIIICTNKNKNIALNKNLDICLRKVAQSENITIIIPQITAENSKISAPSITLVY